MPHENEEHDSNGILTRARREKSATFTRQGKVYESEGDSRKVKRIQVKNKKASKKASDM